MKLDKAKLAHEYALKMIEQGYLGRVSREHIAFTCFELADAMQAEADKRAVKGVPDELEWQPDWSQAPENAVEWVKLTEDRFAWLEQSGFSDKLRSLLCDAPSFGYIGSIENSLRKRPEGK